VVVQKATCFQIKKYRKERRKERERKRERNIDPEVREKKKQRAFF
jgi:hypothetical protein